MTRQNAWNFDNTFTTGDFLYADSGSTLAKLPIGNAGEVLTVSGTSPVWAPGVSGSSGVLLQTKAFTSTSEAVFSGFDTTYHVYLLVFNDFCNNGGGLGSFNMGIQLSDDGGSTFKNTNYVDNSAITSYFAPGIVTFDPDNLNIAFYFFGLTEAQVTRYHYQSLNTPGYHNDATAMNAFRLYYTDGTTTFNQGEARLFGWG